MGEGRGVSVLNRDIVERHRGTRYVNLKNEFARRMRVRALAKLARDQVPREFNLCQY